MNNIPHKQEPLIQPPYSAYLRAGLNHPEKWHQYAGSSADGSGVSLFLVCGSKAWDRARKLENSHLFTMLPPSEDPYLYDWSALAGHDPVMAVVEGDPLTDDEYRDMATALLRDGVHRFIRADERGRGLRYLSEEIIKW